MNVAEYQKKREALFRQMNDLKQEYINSKKTFEIGSKVKLTHVDGKVEYGVVINYKIDSFDDVVPIIAKMKKDGTAHPTATLYVFTATKVEQINN